MSVRMENSSVASVSVHHSSLDPFERVTELGIETVLILLHTSKFLSLENGASVDPTLPCKTYATPGYFTLQTVKKSKLSSTPAFFRHPKCIVLVLLLSLSFYPLY